MNDYYVVSTAPDVLLLESQQMSCDHQVMGSTLLLEVGSRKSRVLTSYIVINPLPHPNQPLIFFLYKPVE